eukprot:jgi/Mesvir1/27017/Mv20724-RA.1
MMNGVHSARFAADGSVDAKDAMSGITSSPPGKRTIETLLSVIAKGLVLALTLSALLVHAVFIYILLYNLLLPSEVVSERIVKLDYRKPAPDGLVTFLPPRLLNNGEVTNTTPPDSSFTTSGSAYDIVVTLELPETPANVAVGMFQVSAELLTTAGKVITSTSRPCMLRHRSPLISLARTLIWALPFSFGLLEEKQTIPMLMFDKHTDTHGAAFAALRVALHASAGNTARPPVPQVYSVKASAIKRLWWLPHTMYYWRVTSFLVLVPLVFLSDLLLLLCFMPSLVLSPGSWLSPSRYPTNVVVSGTMPSPAMPLTGSQSSRPPGGVHPPPSRYMRPGSPSPSLGSLGGLSGLDSETSSPFAAHAVVPGRSSLMDGRGAGAGVGSGAGVGMGVASGPGATLKSWMASARVVPPLPDVATAGLVETGGRPGAVSPSEEVMAAHVASGGYNHGGEAADGSGKLPAARHEESKAKDERSVGGKEDKSVRAAAVAAAAAAAAAAAVAKEERAGALAAALNRKASRDSASSASTFSWVSLGSQTGGSPSRTSSEGTPARPGGDDGVAKETQAPGQGWTEQLQGVLSSVLMGGAGPTKGESSGGKAVEAKGESSGEKALGQAAVVPGHSVGDVGSGSHAPEGAYSVGLSSESSSASSALGHVAGQGGLVPGGSSAFTGGCSSIFSGGGGSEGPSGGSEGGTSGSVGLSFSPMRSRLWSDLAEIEEAAERSIGAGEGLDFDEGEMLAAAGAEGRSPSQQQRAWQQPRRRARSRGHGGHGGNGGRNTSD